MLDLPQDINNNLALNTQQVTEQCITETSKRFKLPDILLKAVLAVEAGKTGEIRINKNGTYDLGPMQVNSVWLSKFSNYIATEEILYNGCANLQVGAWILKYSINKANGDLWQGIGNYHSNTTTNHYKYRSKVYTQIQRLKTKYT